MMRHYPRNSPQAAARILAVTLLADGHVSQMEMDALDQFDAHEKLGITRQALHTVIRGVCEDMLSMSDLRWGDTCKVDQRTLGMLLNDIDDITLRQKVLMLCLSVIEADTHVTEAESHMFEFVLSNWCELHPMTPMH